MIIIKVKAILVVMVLHTIRRFPFFILFNHFFFCQERISSKFENNCKFDLVSDSCTTFPFIVLVCVLSIFVPVR